MPARDQRKFDMTTPTLIDEDEEEEMLALQRSRQRHETQSGGSSSSSWRDDSIIHRRTPGASMYKSSYQQDEQHQQQFQTTQIRNTSAASVGQLSTTDTSRSSSTIRGVSSQQEQLGFGLTLSSPVATSTGNESLHGNDNRSSAWELHQEMTSPNHLTPPRATSNQHTSSSTTPTLDHSQQLNRPPPRAPGTGQQHQQQQPQHRGDFTFTPWTPGAQFQSSNTNRASSTGACSPNTLRLTEDLGNLLFEADEDSTDQMANPYVFRGVGQQVSSGATGSNLAESWTSSYVFKSEHQVGDIPSRVPKSSLSRGRRGNKSDSSRGRRVSGTSSRATDEQRHQQMTSFLQHAQQPTPVRSTTLDQSNPFLPGGFVPANDQSVIASYASSGDAEVHQQLQPQPQQPRTFQFGGAFAPPAKDSAVGFRPPVPAPSDGQLPSNQGNSSLFMGSQPPQGNYQASSTGFGELGPATSGPFQSQSFQPLPPMTGPSRDSPYQHPFSSTSGYGSAAVSRSPSYGLPHSSLYPPQQISGMQTNSHEFYPMVAPPSQQHQHKAPPSSHQYTSQLLPPPRQSQQQRWSSSTPTQYGPSAGQQVVWQGSTGTWLGGAPTYPPPGMDHRTGMSPAPSTTQSWPDQSVDYSSVPSPNMFHAAPPPHLEPPAQVIPVAPSQAFAAPVGSPVPSRPESQPQPAQQQGRQKANRKVNKGKTVRKEKVAQKPDLGPSSRKSTPVNPSGRASTTGKKKKSKTKGRSQTPDAASVRSTPSNVPGGEEGVAVDDPASAKKSELVESPATRSAFKDFYRRFRSEERTSFQGAEDFAVQSLGDGSLPGKVHWRVYLELADLAKRSNRFADARRLYQQVCQLQPYASQGWLEYSKLEEECGHLNRGARILRAGLEYCEYSENLLTRAIKHEEKMGNTNRARELLARLKHVGIEKVWRTVLEGALLEARAGNVLMARRVLKYLMHHVPWYGPLYLEAYRLERDLGQTNEALEVVERGLSAIPRYGPLWFGAFRLCEEIDIAKKQFHLPRTMAMIDRATSNISKELIWKVHLDAAQMLERASLDIMTILQQEGEDRLKQYQSSLAHCRNRFAMTILKCPPNLRWKVWLAAGRMEIAVGNTDRARRLFVRAHQVVPEKGRATTLLECARLEEYTGDSELADAILCKSRTDYVNDWKVWLESVLLEIRGGKHGRAIELAKRALDIHPGTGRLWAALVQLRFFEGGEDAQFVSLRKALNAVPKSGEVWCEGGRIHLNPFSHTFNLKRSRRHLFFATKFTPQYGDSFLESLRLELVEQWVSPIAKLVWNESKRKFLDKENFDLSDALKQYIFDLVVELARICCEEGKDTKPVAEEQLRMLDACTMKEIQIMLDPKYCESKVDLVDLELRCANADPNYGLLWFHCRHGPTDTARRTLNRASKKIVNDLRRFVHFYIAAIVRHTALMEIIASDEGKEGGKALPTLDDDAGWENLVDERLLAAPSLYDILCNDEDDKNNREEGVVFLENVIAGSTFATGLAELNRHQPVGNLSLNERRKALFGTDALFS